jgi:hypothetical protein
MISLVISCEPGIIIDEWQNRVDQYPSCRPSLKQSQNA